MKAKALFLVLSKKLKDKEVIFVDSISLKNPKTKEAKVVFDAISNIEGFNKLVGKKANSLFVALPKKDDATERSFRNLSFVKMGEIRNLNILDILKAKYFLMVGPEESLKLLEAKKI